MSTAWFPRRNTQISAFWTPQCQALPSAHWQPCCHLWWKAFPPPFQTDKFFQIKHRWLNICFWEHNKHCNHHIVVIFLLPTGKQEIRLSRVLTIISRKYVFHHQSVLLYSFACLLACLRIHPDVSILPLQMVLILWVRAQRLWMWVPPSPQTL